MSADTPKDLAAIVRAKIESAMSEINMLIALGYTVDVRIETLSQIYYTTGRHVVTSASVRVDITKEERL